MTLADFIERNMGRLLAEWDEFANTRLPAASGMDSDELRDGAEEILSAVAADMRAAQSKQAQREKSRGERPGSAPAVTETAQQHAVERLRGGFTLDQLVAEYRALRASVVSQWTAELGPADREKLNELVRFNEAMDQSLTEAIGWFHQQLDQARHLFIGMLGHDLRDPLNAAMAATELQLLASEAEAHRQQTERVRRNLYRMADMIGSLLDFTRTRLGERLPLDPKPTDLKETCREIVEAFERPDREIRLECAGDLTGNWDEGRLKQLVSNLISNALEHGKRGAPVPVTARKENGEVLLSVHNEGPPIPPENHRTIFDPLAHGDVDAGNERSAGGIGLGLYIVKEIAEAHGGTVDLESTVEYGTTFTVRLPTSQQQ